MSIFEFADQLGFSPPIVFEDDVVSEEGVFTWPINFDALGKDLGSGSPIAYYYKNYVAERQTIIVKDEIGDDLEIDFESQIPMKIDSPNVGKRSLQLIGRLNKKLGTVAIRQHKVFFDFELELGTSISFIKKIEYAHQDEVAIELIANSYDDYSALSNYLGVGENEKVRNKISNDFDRAFRNASGDEKSLKWLYQRAPQFVINQRGDDQLVKDLKLLTAYDLDSWFVDTGSAVINIVYGFNDLAVLYDDFQKHPEDVLRIYDALNDAKKEEFTMLLTSVAKFISGNSAISKFIIGKNYIVDSNLSVKDSQKTVHLQQYNYVDGAEVTTSSGGVGFPGGTVSVGTSRVKEIVKQTQTEFGPLDLIILENEDTKEVRFASALEVKFLSNKKEWDQIMIAVAIIATVVGTLASLGILGAGATGVVAVIATLEIAVAIGDLTLIFRKAGLKGTEEGDWFIKNWEKISIGTAVISISSAIRQGILRNGPKTLTRLRALKGVKVAAIKERIRVLLFNVIINVEIANFGEVAFKVVPFENIRAISGLSIASKKIKKLWDLNVLILDAVVDGKLVYALYYNGQVIISGAAKEIDDFLKTKIFTHGAKDAEILKILDNIAERVRNVGFHHIPTSGVIISSKAKKGTYLLGGFKLDLQFVLKQLDYPEYLDANELAKGFEFFTPSGQKFNLLNVSEQVVRSFARKGGFFNRINAKWVDKAVERAEDILLITKENGLYRMITVKGKRKRVITGYGKEVHRLEWKHNYRYNPRTHQMVPPDQAEGLKTLTKFDDHKIVTIYK